MKAIVGFGFFLLFLAGIALVMLQGRQLTQLGAPSGGAAITGISWRPTLVGIEQIPDDSGMSVRFEVDGSIKGHGGCNDFFGSLQQTETGIDVGPLGSTRMACPQAIMDRERAFLNALQKTSDFNSGSNTMRLLDEANTVLAELVDSADD